MDNLDDLLCDAALGRIYREMQEELASIEEDYLDKKEPTAKDFLKAALESLMVIGDRLKGARTIEPNAIHGDTLPAPLDRLMHELSDLKRGEIGNASPLLTPGNVPGQGRRPKGKSSLHMWFARAQSVAIVIYDALIEFGRPADQAAKEVAKCFQARGVKLNGNPVTAARVKEWSNERGRDKTRLPRLVTDQFADLDKFLEELRNWEYVKPVAERYVETGFYLREVKRVIYEAVCIPTNDGRAEMLLDWLRDFISTTACD